MRINIVGAGPAGSYFALLMKKATPELDIHVYERSARDVTWGFGVVFSDDTLNGFLDYDLPSFQHIVGNFAYWDTIETRIGNRRIISGGHGFCGMSRIGLLNILHARCAELGVQLHFETDVRDFASVRDADLIVAADGIASGLRDQYRDWFGTTIETRKNRFCWLATTMPLDAFTFIFRKSAAGWFWVHAYRYAADRSTWLVECSERTWRESGMDRASEAETVHFLEWLFAADLEGHRLLTNRSIWRAFPVIRNARWHHENIVLLGDCAHTAHFSIGSGTKMAMEDAVALFEAFRAHAQVRDALPAYDAARREETEILQHTAGISLKWFEDAERYLETLEPEQVVFSMLSRSKRLTFDNLAVRDPGYVADLTRWFAGHARRIMGLPIDTVQAVVPIFQPFRIGGLVVPNRIALSPMCQYSAIDGVPTEWHYIHYGSRAIGGPGLLYTEMICISPEARITPGCAGLYTDSQTAAWRRIFDFVHAHSEARVCAQIGHAGPKGATRLAWDGIDEPLADGAWPIVAASPIPYAQGSAIPRALDPEAMAEICAEFVRATRQADLAGADMIEVHMAHGYLLSSFISPVTNRRTDAYGGPVEHRMRFPLDCLRAMRSAWPAVKPISVRISACDWVEHGLTEGDMLAVARLLKDNGADIINVSTGQVTPDQQPVYGRMYQAPFSDQVRNEVGIPTIVAGNIVDLDQANTLVAAGRADIVALARPLLGNPYLVLDAAARYGYSGQRWPVQYAAGKSQAEQLAIKARNEMNDLKRAAKPLMPYDALAVAIGRQMLASQRGTTGDINHAEEDM